VPQKWTKSVLVNVHDTTTKIFANDMDLLAQTVEGLQRSVDIIAVERGMQINVMKTKVMVYDKQSSIGTSFIRLGPRTLKAVTHLGSLMAANSKSIREITRQINMATEARRHVGDVIV